MRESTGVFENPLDLGIRILGYSTFQQGKSLLPLR